MVRVHISAMKRHGTKQKEKAIQGSRKMAAVDASAFSGNLKAECANVVIVPSQFRAANGFVFDSDFGCS